MDTKPSPFVTRQATLWMLAVLLFILGLAVRLYDLTDLPLDFHPTRQLHSALMARGMYYQDLESAPDWRREMAVRQWKMEGVIEPPVMEWLAASAYRLAGEELLWLPRLFSIFFWMIGGVGLFLWAGKIGVLPGAVAALAFYLILPYGVIASRSFQPDPLMTALTVWALWAVSRWSAHPAWKNALLAGALGGIAILIKSVAVFFVAPAFAAAVLVTLGFKKSVRSIQIWAIAFLAILPYAFYHIYGVYLAGFLQSQFSQRFFPAMWIDPTFYLQWSRKIDQVVGLHWFILGILGSFLYRNRHTRASLLSLWAGYFVYGLALPHHISTHDYYHLPLIPLVALGLAGGVPVMWQQLQGAAWVRAILVLSLFIFGIGYYAWDARTTLKRSDYRLEAAYWQEIGTFLGRSSNVAALTQDYGARLSYWGWTEAMNWPWLGDLNFQGEPATAEEIAARFEEQAAGRDYFLMTAPEELERQPILKDLLAAYPVVFREGDAVIYDLQNPLQ
ncbi:MAG: glycosyltransferase family 39 protein [Anaerolineaceae bacterium]|nr:glycosyltransferase family 39 protein [Anaerolineaceae bacterium]